MELSQTTEQTDYLTNLLEKQKVAILDGGFSTECKELGARMDLKLWSANLLKENPEIIKKVHMAFYEAGADICITSSYQASFEGFKEKGYDLETSIGLF